MNRINNDNFRFNILNLFEDVLCLGLCENITSIIEQAHKADAKYIYPSFGVTLRDNQRLYFFEKIGPELTKKYIDTFGESYMCASPNQKELKKHFTTLCEKYGILYKMKDIVKATKNHVKKQQLTFDL